MKRQEVNYDDHAEILSKAMSLWAGGWNSYWVYKAQYGRGNMGVIPSCIIRDAERAGITLVDNKILITVEI